MTEHPTTVEPLLTVKEVAALLRVHARQVERLVAAGRLPRPVYLSRSRRWRPGDLAAALAGLPHERTAA